ncbi:MAG: hypothetical protein KGH84_05305 [Paracoccaceae bacterium]|nr:hypothetical protein [Paracoccaceae bacterium]
MVTYDQDLYRARSIAPTSPHARRHSRRRSDTISGWWLLPVVVLSVAAWAALITLLIRSL